MIFPEEGGSILLTVGNGTVWEHRIKRLGNGSLIQKSSRDANGTSYIQLICVKETFCFQCLWLLIPTEPVCLNTVANFPRKGFSKTCLYQKRIGFFAADCGMTKAGICDLLFTTDIMKKADCNQHIIIHIRLCCGNFQCIV